MRLSLGVKSDPVEYRYSYEWLLSFLEKRRIRYLQLGSFFELYHLDDRYFVELRKRAESHGVEVRSCFTAHRELGGFFTGDRHLVAVARKCYERLIEVASILGASYVGSNPGAVYRDRMEEKASGIACYLEHLRELTRYAAGRGIDALTMEPMSSLAEPPSTPEEIMAMVDAASQPHRTEGDGAVPVYLCGDVSHGVVDADGEVRYDHEELFALGIPMMAEFHLKNTDSSYHSTFGFGPADRRRGIVDLARIRSIIEANADRWPVEEVTAYLEIGGPKLGRDYADPLLESMLEESIAAIREVFPEPTIFGASPTPDDGL